MQRKARKEMPLATANCPHCDAQLSEAPAGECPDCGRSLQDTLARAPRDLNVTAEFLVSAAPAPTDDLVGCELANYRIEDFLGQGGMARVYRARHLTLERPCAIKVLRPSFVDRIEAAAATFLAEARAAAALVHPHVVTIHSIGFDRNQHFIEMEFVDGQSLSGLVDEQGPFGAEEATRLMVQICSALALAHAQGMVHRDIKPANVLVTRDRVAKLADFGLAKRIQDAHLDDGQCLSGTPNYMAPELFAGAIADKRSDIYAMGVTNFLLLTGQLPFAGESLTELMQNLRQSAAPDVRTVRPDVPGNAAWVVNRCLAKNPEDRFPDAEALLGELRAVYGTLRGLEALLRESLKNTGAVLHGEGDRFEVLVKLKDGRTQKVIVEIKESSAIAEQVVRISSICGPADERHYRKALELNPNFPYGAMGVETIQGVAHFVMTNVYPRATCDIEEIRHSVLGIAQHADDAERWLTGMDRH